MREERKRRRSPEDSSRRRGHNSDRHKRDSSPRERHRESKYSKRDAIKTEAETPKPKTEIKTQPLAEEQPVVEDPKVLENELRQKEVLYKAKMELQERIRHLNMPNANIQPLKSEAVLKPAEASAFVNYQMMSRLDELKRKVASRSQAVSATATAPTKSEKQSTGDDIFTKTEKAEISPDVDASPGTAFEVRADSSSALIEYLDPRVKLKPATRHRRANFDFKVQGEYQKIANTQRAKAKLEQLQSEIALAAKHTGISSAVKLAIVTPSGVEAFDSHVPEIEWWDEIVLGPGKRYDDIPSGDSNPEERYAETITNLVEHPIQLKPPDEPTQPQYLKACLTSKERRKLRRQNRRELLKEKMEKVRLGLEPAPEPKLKISNLMRVLGNDAVQDPTKMEAHVRKQIADRLQKHERDNKERQLTDEQRAEKAARKIAEDTSLAVHVAIYKVKSLANPSKRFKIHMNAKQLQMTGIFLTLDDLNVIVVEGGPKQQKFYENLMIRRIKWADEIAGQKKEISRTKNDQGERNECSLIWKGIVQRRAFGEPKFVAANSHKHAREILDKQSVAHYWDLCYSTTVLLSSDD